MNSQQFWARVAQVKTELPDGDFFAVHSLDAPDRGFTGGSTCEVDRQDAARLIALGSHRLATSTEVEANRQAVESRRADYQQKEYHRMQNSGLRVVVEQGSTAAVAPPPSGGAEDLESKQSKKK